MRGGGGGGGVPSSPSTRTAVMSGTSSLAAAVHASSSQATAESAALWSDASNSVSSSGSSGELTAKLVLLGDAGVGKTSLVTRYVQNVFATETKSTVGASFVTKRFNMDDWRIRLQLWDTAGQERFRSMAPLYYHGASGAVVVVDATSQQSVEGMKLWVEELRSLGDPGTIICIACNKIDLPNRQVSLVELEEFGNSVNARVFETSAKAGVGVFEVFNHIVRRLVDAQRISSGPQIGSGSLMVRSGDVLPPKNSSCSC